MEQAVPAVEQLRLLGLVALALGMGAVVGFDRERHDKPAGIRTHALVAGAAALVMVIGQIVLGDHRGDASRSLHAVVTGIGFLCAGAIIRDGVRGAVTGLTTAATLFIAASIGSAVGANQLLLAGGVTVLVLVVLNLGRMPLLPHSRGGIANASMSASAGTDATSDAASERSVRRVRGADGAGS